MGRWPSGSTAALRLALGALVFVALPALAQVVLRDDLGREVRFEQPPQRVVTLLPSLTETVCALGACGRLVATDRYSDWPPSVAALPKAGGLDDAQIETIAGLRPDLVLLSSSSRVTQRLGPLGIKTFALEPHDFEGIGRSIETVGRLLGLPQQAAALEREIERGVEAQAREPQARRRAAHPPRVYFEVDGGPYAAGESSYIGELLARLGTRNIVPAALGPFPKLNPEYVVRADPDVMFVSPQEAPKLARRPGWDGIRAVREGRVCSFDAKSRDAVMRPGPRVVEGMKALALCLDRKAP